MSGDWPGAVISDDRNYRYVLSREWIGGSKTITFIGLNPSTADAIQDDPTIRRCIGFAKAWDGSRLLMVNLFGYRSTDPAALRGVRDPIGELNDFWLRRAVLESDVAIAAWGAGGSLLSRAQQITERFGSRLQVLGYTKDGAPRHPLYLRKTSLPQPMLINS